MKTTTLAKGPMGPRPDPGRPRTTGFTLVELLVVVAIIGIMAAIAIPNIAGYIRNYRIRSATQAVASEIGTARLKAIMKNVNFGVIFVVLPPGAPGNSTTQVGYKWAVEDTGATSRPDNTTLLGLSPPQTGTVRYLPEGIRFGTGCVLPTGAGTFAVDDEGLRFNRMGTWCNPDSSTSWGQAYCPELAFSSSPNPGTGSQNSVYNGGTQGSFLCLEQPDTGNRRWVWVTPGGRVLSQP